eukprot:gb/GECG01009049.1/.p1 GENE.gb/GECG01009049.1/~~gb/GECG01009049.1/.p1  ORF type:complete len:482 (+),score=46.27 gb/GECG01009049.1/:1-1446(+)
MRLARSSLSVVPVLAVVLALSQNVYVSAYTPIIQNATIWPQPHEFSTGSNKIPVSPHFHFKCSRSSPAGCPDPLPAAFSRYIATDGDRRLIFVEGSPNSLSQDKNTETAGALEVVEVLVRNDEPLEFGVNESYTLEVKADGHATIEGWNQWGALRGIESLSQLIWWDANVTDETVYYLHGAPVSVTDDPRFPWRGVLIDSSRHFLSKKSIFRILDSMSFVKYNVLHWHLTDDQSWPLKSDKYPNFTKKAAYRPGTVYDHGDVEDIVNYAFERGIMVIPEIDMPAHASSWGLAYPQLTIQCPGHQTLLDPTDTDSFNVYAVFDDLMEEFDPLFNTSGFFHIGGDEVKDTYCWQTSSKVQSWMNEKGFNTIHEVRNYFENQIQAIVQKHKKRAILWEEVYDDGFHFDSSSIVNAWLSSVVKNVTSNGLSLIYNYGTDDVLAITLSFKWILSGLIHCRMVSRSAKSTRSISLSLGRYVDQFLAK